MLRFGSSLDRDALGQRDLIHRRASATSAQAKPEPIESPFGFRLVVSTCRRYKDLQTVVLLMEHFEYRISGDSMQNPLKESRLRRGMDSDPRRRASIP